eukprot:GHVS01095667.1.p1 GENE.GHVS01095667.1~~GHVS01095667.1.p1  ORF type:complete len:161 (-),score=27.97 GHVS01095667.1:120-602(-)
MFHRVDLVEPNSAYIRKAREYLKDLPVDEYYCVALQDFTPTANRYDCIWLQWCVLYLTDTDLISLLRRCAKGLTPNGIICVKENVKLDGVFLVDKSDNSIMRTDEHYRSLFRSAELQLLLDRKQQHFPKSLLPVYMYALKPLLTQEEEEGVGTHHQQQQQ